ncbi:MAG: type 1 glutamine amidotransferase [Hyphomicrobiales bacterium]|nr:type 1 glutamine amidotransferase [Hyphomicrobiales bacterium]
MLPVKPRTIGIIEAGLTPPIIAAAHGDFPAMIERWLSPALPEAHFKTIAVIKGEDLPDARDYDAYVITGSEAGVYDRLIWMAPLKEFILFAAAARVPQFGICFGHQIMTEAFGGRVIKSPQGWQCGLYDYKIDANELLPEITMLPMLALHQDQVVEPPPGAQLIGAHEASPYAMLQYRPEAFSTQCHPEFDVETVKAYLRLGKLSVPQTLVESSALAMQRSPANDKIAALTAAVFRRSWLTL